VLLGLGSTAMACAASDDLAETGEDELQCKNASAIKLASVAKKMDGKRSQGYCYRYVKAHLRAAGFSTHDIEAKGYGASAFKFSVWAKANPNELAKMGLKKVRLELDELPKGAVIAWPRGMCGYNKTHGHIEVVVDDASSRACSDYCGRIKKGCGTPDIYVPSGCVTPQSDEADDDDDSVKAPAVEGDAPTDPASPASDGDEEDVQEEAGSCWSPTLDRQADAFTCVQSASNRVWFQCKDGKWYRGVSGNQGPFAECTSKEAL
jgi:hypothetical protein